MKNRKREFSGPNRRQWPRLSPAEVPSLKSVTINQGTDAQVIDISRGGMLLETEDRLPPQRKIFLKVVTSKGIFKISGHVVRSSIKSLAGIPVYQSAVVFDNPLSVLDGLEKRAVQNFQEPPVDPVEEKMSRMQTDPQPSRIAPEVDFEDDPTVVTVIAPEGFDLYFNGNLRLNDW